MNQNELFCEEHTTRKIGLACTNPACKQQRLCCFVCVQSKHVNHINDVKELDMLSMEIKDCENSTEMILTQIDEFLIRVDEHFKNIKAQFKRTNSHNQISGQLKLSELREKIQLAVDYQLGKHKHRIKKIEQVLRTINQELDTLANCFAKGHYIVENSQQSIQQTTKRIKQLTQQQNYEEAYKLVEELLIVDPQNVQALSFKAKLLCNQNKKQEAIQIYQQLEQKDPTNPNIVLQLCNSLTGLGQFQQSLEKCQQFLQTQPDNVEILRVKTQCLIKLQQFPEALGILLQMDESNPCEKTKFQIGDILRKLGDIKGSIHYFEQAQLFGDKLNDQIQKILIELRNQL